MWHAITEFLLKAHAENLSHEAVIEIMVALLGVMMAVMALLMVLVSLVFAGLGFFGYKAIEEKAIAAAETKAESTAKETAEKVIASQIEKQQAIDLSDTLPPLTKTESKPTVVKRTKKTSDAGLTSLGKEEK